MKWTAYFFCNLRLLEGGVLPLCRQLFANAFRSLSLFRIIMIGVVPILSVLYEPEDVQRSVLPTLIQD